MLNREALRVIVRNAVLAKCMVETGTGYIPVGVSSRHVHLSSKDVESLFGPGYRLTPLRYLSQPGQFACKETVILTGPRGKIENVRVLGPERNDTQVELAVTDCIKIGIKPVIRMSGDIKDTPGCSISGPAGQICLDKGVIVAMRHLHTSYDEAKIYGLEDGNAVTVRKSGDRRTVFENVIVRCGNEHRLEMHIDTDEANAASIASGDILELVQTTNLVGDICYMDSLMIGETQREIITESDIQSLTKRPAGGNARIPDTIRCENTCIILVPDIFGRNVLAAAVGMFEGYELLFAHDGQGIESIPSGSKVINIGEDGAKIYLINALRYAKAVCCIAPGLKLMEAIADGNDDEFFSLVIIKAVLMGKRIEVVTDFDCDVTRNGVFFRKVWGLLEGLKSMGIDVSGVKMPQHAALKDEGCKDLITEKDILMASYAGLSTVHCVVKGIITPLAADTAREKGIEIIRK